MADFYAELPINIKITGNYHDMGRSLATSRSCHASSP
jgi:Tfp pilus assembly protein PilO